MFSYNPKRFALINKKIHLLFDKGRLSAERAKKKKDDLFSKLLWCSPLFPLGFSLDAHCDCQLGRNCCRDTKNCSNYTCNNYYSKAQPAGQRGVIRNYSHRMNYCQLFVAGFRLSGMSHLKYCILIQQHWQVLNDKITCTGLNTN